MMPIDCAGCSPRIRAIDHVQFVARADALEQLKHSTGLADVIGGLQQNPLPDAFIIYPKPGGGAGAGSTAQRTGQTAQG